MDHPVMWKSHLKKQQQANRKSQWSNVIKMYILFPFDRNCEPVLSEKSAFVINSIEYYIK